MSAEEVSIGSSFLSESDSESQKETSSSSELFASETTPLVSTTTTNTNTNTNTNINSGNYYFLNKLTKKTSSIRDGDDSDFIEIYPTNITTKPPPEGGDYFASRPVRRRDDDAASDGNTNTGGNVNVNVNVNSSAPVVGGGSSLMQRRSAAIKVEPKIFFSNERTFLAWLHTSVLLAGASIAFSSFTQQSSYYNQIYGVILLPVAIAFIVYAMFQYNKRCEMISRRAPGPYEDIKGPVMFSIVLMLSILAQFSLKLYTILGYI